MDESIRPVVEKLKSHISDKYKMTEMQVFGSTARNRRRPDSDIDIFILLPRVDRKIEEDLFDLSYELELKYDCLIDLIIFDEDSLREQFSFTPFYRKVISEGVSV